DPRAPAGVRHRPVRSGCDRGVGGGSRPVREVPRRGRRRPVPGRAVRRLGEARGQRGLLSGGDAAAHPRPGAPAGPGTGPERRAAGPGRRRDGDVRPPPAGRGPPVLAAGRGAAAPLAGAGGRLLRGHHPDRRAARPPIPPGPGVGPGRVDPDGRAMTPLVSVIIVSYQTRELTVACLKSLRAACTRVPYEVIVVDNASTDGSAAAVAEAAPYAKLLRLDSNVGF